MFSDEKKTKQKSHRDRFTFINNCDFWFYFWFDFFYLFVCLAQILNWKFVWRVKKTKIYSYCLYLQSTMMMMIIILIMSKSCQFSLLVVVCLFGWLLVYASNNNNNKNKESGQFGKILSLDKFQDYCIASDKQMENFHYKSIDRSIITNSNSMQQQMMMIWKIDFSFLFWIQLSVRRLKLEILKIFSFDSLIHQITFCLFVCLGDDLVQWKKRGKWEKKLVDT